MRLPASLRELRLSLAVCSRRLKGACEDLWYVQNLPVGVPLSHGFGGEGDAILSQRIRLHQCCPSRFIVVFGICDAVPKSVI